MGYIRHHLKWVNSHLMSVSSELNQTEMDFCHLLQFLTSYAHCTVCPLPLLLVPTSSTVTITQRLLLLCPHTGLHDQTTTSWLGC